MRIRLSFRTQLFAILVAMAVTLIAGCSQEIPPKLEVRDVGSGRTYYTYQPWGEVTKGVGYEFTDIETGKRVNLTNYEVRTLESKKSVPADSPDATAFKEAKARGGVK
jgi:hypothetical protein